MSTDQQHDLDTWDVDQPIPLVPVDHFYWVSDLKFAKAHGIECRSLCGVWEDSKPAKEMGEVDLIGGLMPDVDSDDCETCAEVYAARAWADSMHD